jgi:Xaa-Pro aminopeptidase
MRRAAAISDRVFAELASEPFVGARRPSSPGGSSRRGTRPAPTARRSSAIVAFGENGARPHAKLRDVPIPEARSSSSKPAARSAATPPTARAPSSPGSPSGRLRDLYDPVPQGAAGRPRRGAIAGAIGREVDAASRVAIAEAGMGELYGHGLGHGIGLDVHEEPSLRPGVERPCSSQGNVVTVEPGSTSRRRGRPHRGHGRRHRGRLRRLTTVTKEPVQVG